MDAQIELGKRTQVDSKTSHHIDVTSSAGNNVVQFATGNYWHSAVFDKMRGGPGGSAVGDQPRLGNMRGEFLASSRVLRVS